MARSSRVPFPSLAAMLAEASTTRTKGLGARGVLEGEDHEGRPQEEEEEPQVKPWPEAPRPPPLPKPHPGPGPRPRGPPPVEEVDQKEDGKEEPEHPALRLPLLE